MTLRGTLAVATLAVAFASTARAGEMYGSVSEGATKLGAGVVVEIACGGKQAGSTQTDKTGTYHLDVAGTGKCQLTVKHKDQAASIEVVSYEEGAQVDLVLEVKDGKLTVRRK
jgi:hypothetical protein